MLVFLFFFFFFFFVCFFSVWLCVGVPHPLPRISARQQALWKSDLFVGTFGSERNKIEKGIGLIKNKKKWWNVVHILWGGGIENNSPAKAICFVLCVRVRVCVNESAQRLISDFYERPPRCFHPHTRASLRFILWEVNSCPEPDSPIPISDTCAQLLEGGKSLPWKKATDGEKKRDTHVNEIIVTTKPAWAAWRWYISLFDPRPPKINKDLKKKKKSSRKGTPNNKKQLESLRDRSPIDGSFCRASFNNKKIKRPFQNGKRVAAGRNWLCNLCKQNGGTHDKISFFFFFFFQNNDEGERTFLLLFAQVYFWARKINVNCFYLLFICFVFLLSAGLTSPCHFSCCRNRVISLKMVRLRGARMCRRMSIHDVWV